jgi:hypothetical protein
LRKDLAFRRGRRGLGSHLRAPASSISATAMPRAPARAKASTRARPIPVPPPVTITVLLRTSMHVWFDVLMNSITLAARAAWRACPPTRECGAEIAFENFGRQPRRRPPMLIDSTSEPSARLTGAAAPLTERSHSACATQKPRRACSRSPRSSLVRTPCPTRAVVTLEFGEHRASPIGWQARQPRAPMADVAIGSREPGVSLITSAPRGWHTSRYSMS